MPVLMDHENRNHGSIYQYFTPILVYEEIMANLGKKATKIYRLVCPEWNAVVDYHYGLNVSVNEDLPGNVDFIQKVAVRGLTVQKLTTVDAKTPILASPEKLLRLTISGPVNAELLLEQCRRVKILKIDGRGLMSGPLNLNPSETSNKFPYLEELDELHLNIGTQNFWYLRGDNKSGKIAAENINALLSMKFPKITTLVLNINHMWREVYGFLSNLNWRTSLDSFLQRNSGSMKLVILNSIHDGDEVKVYYRIPAQQCELAADLSTLMNKPRRHWLGLMLGQELLQNQSLETPCNSNILFGQSLMNLSTRDAYPEYSIVLNIRLPRPQEIFGPIVLNLTRNESTNSKHLELAASRSVRMQTISLLTNRFTLLEMLEAMELLGFRTLSNMIKNVLNISTPASNQARIEELDSDDDEA